MEEASIEGSVSVVVFVRKCFGTLILFSLKEDPCWFLAPSNGKDEPVALVMRDFSLLFLLLFAPKLSEFTDRMLTDYP